MDICRLAAKIEGNIKNDTDYSQLEETVGYSYHHIRDFFKQIVHVSLSRYILARKIANAAFEIRHSKKSITEIALEYDFTNADTFARAFRRNTGLTPSQFKQSAYLCGRRIICPGVYAPVILQHDNPIRMGEQLAKRAASPMFTLQHIKEVNEMGALKKTEDSCVLYGVPKVYFGRKVDGEEQNLPFPMCLQSVLNYMGQNINYMEIMAYSGAAFRQRWDRDGWNIAAIDIRFTYDQHLTPFELSFKGAGRRFKISEKHKKSIDKNEAIALIKSEIDCGRPVIALGVVGPPEASVITGYRNNGETLLGWSLFQDFWGGGAFDESGYFIKDNWWENTEAIMSIGEEIVSPTTDNQVLENALMLMTTGEVATYGGDDIFYGGQTAYEAWALALEDDNFPNNVEDAQKDAEKMLVERGYAAAYMHLMAERHPDKATEFKECARLLKAAADYAPQIIKLREKHGLKDIETREQMATLIRKAAKCEKEACALLAQLLGRTPTQIKAMAREMTKHVKEVRKAWELKQAARSAIMQAQFFSETTAPGLGDAEWNGFDKEAYRSYLIEKKKKQGVIDKYMASLDEVLNILGDAEPTPDTIKTYMHNQYHGVTVLENARKFLRELSNYCAKASPVFENAIQEYFRRNWEDSASTITAGSRTSARVTVPIPPGTKINPRRLSKLTNDEYVQAFATLQGIIISIHEDIVRNPAEWGYENNVMQVFGALVNPYSHEDDVSVVERYHFDYADRIKERPKGTVKKIINGLTAMGFHFEDFEGNSETFSMSYPDSPNVINVLKDYCKPISNGASSCGDCGDDCFEGCYKINWYNPSSFSYRYVEDPATQTHDIHFLANADWLPEAQREVMFWLHDEAIRHGFIHHRGNIYKKGSKAWLNFGSDKSYHEQFHMPPGTLNYALVIRLPLKKIYITNPEVVVELAERFPEAIEISKCHGGPFYFCDPTLDDAKVILEWFKLENKIKPLKSGTK